MTEIMAPGFWIALLQIIGIDIVLSGDNAVVIALATRSLPAHQQKRAIMWGSGAAVAMRVALAVVAVQLLKLPGLKLAGALLLLWIAVQLLMPEDESEGGEMSASSMATAVRTILLADLAMSLDNVLAIAAVAKGSVLLLILGLAISIPLVIFTSTFLLKVMERFPFIVTAGAALLGYVAGEMIVTDQLSGPWIEGVAHWLHTAIPFGTAAAVVVTGRWLAARARARDIRQPLVDLAADASPDTSKHP